jgi:hypothetical protein
VKAQTEVLLGTSWGTIWELGAPFENLMGTWKRIKNSSPNIPERKKLDPSRGHAEPYHWLHETFISKTVCHHF